MRPLLIFDGDCGFCTASVKFIRRWIRPDCDIEPWQFTAIEEFDLTPDECSTAVQYVDSDRRVYAGSRAVMRMLRDAPPPWPVLGSIGDAPGVAWVADRTYKWIALNRYRLPGSTPACAVNATQVAKRGGSADPTATQVAKRGGSADPTATRHSA